MIDVYTDTLVFLAGRASDGTSLAGVRVRPTASGYTITTRDRRQLTPTAEAEARAAIDRQPNILAVLNRQREEQRARRLGIAS